MEIFWAQKKYRKENPKVVKTKNGRIMLLSKCAASDGKKLRFVKEQEVTALLSSLGMKTPLSTITLVGPYFFTGINKLIQDIK